jgi:hypothetical protein
MAGLASRWASRERKTLRGRVDCAISMGAMKSKAIRRTDYLIDSYHVSFESGAGWLCMCAEFTATDDCRHTREAQGRHAAQALISNRQLSTLDRSGHRR